MVVDVPVSVRERLGNDRELASCETSDDIALRQDDAAEGRNVPLEIDDAAGQVRASASEDLLFQLVQPLLQLLDLRAIVIHHRVDDAVHQRRRALPEDPAVPRADVSHLADRSRDARMNGDQVAVAEEEIDVLRVEGVLARLEIDAVEDDVQVVAVGLDFRMVNLGDRILDRQLVELEYVGQDPHFTRIGVDDVHPHPHPAVMAEPVRFHPIDQPGGTVLVSVDRNQSPTFTCSAACAAASRATGIL